MIGIFGGTFDPIHEGHTHLAKLLLQHYPFEKILFIPNRQNPMKATAATASGELRFRMIEEALAEIKEPRFQVSRLEIDRESPSYMMDTVGILKKEFSAPLVLILGNEVFDKIQQWKDVKRLLETVSVLVVKREVGVPIDPQQLLRKLHIFTQGNNFPWIKEFADHVLDLSSTQMRKTIEDAWKKDNLEKPVQGIQRSVWQVIKANKLYAR